MSENKQGTLFPDPKDPALETWPQVVARRMQSLVMGFPIQQMVAKGTSGYYPDWAAQNFAFLALQIFDAVFARMAPGVGRGATREEIVLDLSPYILDRQPELSERQVEDIVDFILNNLMNDGRGVFETECIWLEDEHQTTPYLFRYGLLKSYHDPETDRFIIRATAEALHLYLRMLDQPVEDEQIANLFILQEQVRRGRIGQTRREAERTMLLSLEYERYIEDMLRSVRRDVRSVDWVRDVTPRIEQAHQHVQRLIQEQGKVLRELKKELHHNEDIDRIKAIHELIDVLELCQHRHMELERRILDAGPSFLEEQAYQRFRQLARSPMPDLNDQVFLPALTIDEPFFKPILPDLFHAVLGPGIHRIMDLEALVDRLLREDHGHEPKADEDAMDERVPVVDRFHVVDHEVEEKIGNILLSIDDDPVRLSQLIDQGRRDGLETEDLAVVGVTLLHSYHARSDLLGLTVSKDGHPLDDPDFIGDDLIIKRQLSDTFTEQ